MDPREVASRSTSESSPRVRLLREEAEFETIRPAPDGSDSSAPRASPAPMARAASSSRSSNGAFLQAMTGTMAAIAQVLATRLLLMLAGAGAFLLAWETVKQPEMGKLIACGIYDGVVFLPTVWLYATRG